MGDFASFGSFLTPASSGAGKSGGTGGGLFGAVPSGKGNHVSLCFLDPSLVGRSFCGGVIGAERKRMCTLDPGVCSVSSHKSKVMQPADFPFWTDSTADGVLCAFIETQDAKSVFMAAHVPAAFLGDEAYYKGQQRSVAQWEQFLTALRGAGENALPTSAERDAFFEHVSDRIGLTASKTPFKKRRVFAEDASPLSSQLDSAGMEEELLLDVSLELDPINTIPKLIKEWPLLVNNLSMLQGLIVTCRQSLKDCNHQFAKDFREVDYLLSDLGNAMGKKPASMEAGTVFDLIESLDRKVRWASDAKLTPEQVETLVQAKAILRGMDPSERPLQEKLDAFSNSVKTAVSPLWSLLVALSKDHSAPTGDKLEPIIRLLDHWPFGGAGGGSDVLAWIEQAEVRIASQIGRAHV